MNTLQRDYDEIIIIIIYLIGNGLASGGSGYMHVHEYEIRI